MTSSATSPRPRAARRSQRRRVEPLGRAGLVARGIVYGVVGLLSLKVALGVGGKTTSQTGALQTIAHEPLGSVLLVILAVGLAGYAVWRLAIALGFSGRDGALDRVSAAGGALGYGALSYVAVRILAGTGTSGGSGAPRRAAAGVLGWPGGPVLVAATGAVLIGIGLYQAYEGLSGKFLEDSDTGRMSDTGRRMFVALAGLGHLARAVIFGVIGFGLIKAALDYSPGSALGLDGALAKLAHTSGGPVLLGAVAAGFIAFGLYSIIDARYHRM